MLTVFWEQHSVVLMTLSYHNNPDSLCLITGKIKGKLLEMEARSYGYEIILYYPYCRDFTSSDYKLILSLKSFLKGIDFSDDDILLTEVQF